ncbi:MATE family efflux transporter [candidate division KSB1 bacterium]|nr:MATE family efflux transporter [candidate division KSB1 bacterium]
MTQTKTDNTIILQGSINRGIFKLALPAMISMVSIMFFEIIDLFWIGRLGSHAVAALGAASFVIWTMKALANCTVAGINAFVARVAGSGDDKAVQIWSNQGILASGLFGIVISILFYYLNHILFSLLGLEPEVARLAHDYTFIMILGIVFIYETFAFDTIFRSLGNTFIPMLITVITLSINAILDPFFIFGWFGFPQLGVAGGAVASVIAHIAGLFLFLFWLPAIPLKLRWIGRDFLKNSLQIFKIGLPIGFLEAFFSLIYIFLSKIIAYFGTTPLAAITAGHRIEALPFFLSFGFSVAVATFVGQNLGNQNPERAEKAVKIALGYAVIFLAFISMIYIFTGKTLLGFFIQDSAVIETGYEYLFAISIFEIFLAFEVILQGAFTGAGDTRPPFIISVIFTFLRIPAAYFFAIVFGFGVQAIWWTISISTFLKGIFMYFWFIRGHWKRRKLFEHKN